MFSSEAVTRGIRVRVRSEYSAERSRPAKNEWFFLYTVTISNEGTEPVQLVTRHWIITDGTGKIDEVRGPGVVGKQPTLKPGEGTYQMIAGSGERFDAKVAPFTLSEPYTVH
jgi:ApaG protein